MDRSDVDELIETALYDVSPIDRDSARAALLQRTNRDQLKRLLILLDTSNKTIRRRALRLLGDMNPTLLRPQVIEAFRDPKTKPRVLMALARMLSAQTRVEESLLDLGLQHRDPQVRRACATRVAPKSALINGLFDENPHVREKCAQCLNETETRLDAATINRLGESVTAQDTQCLALIAASAPTHPVLTTNGVQATRFLDYVNDPAQVLSHSEGTETQRAWALSRLRALDAKAEIHSDSRVRQAYARSCPSDAEALTSLQNDADPAVRWMAQRAKLGAFEQHTLNSRLAPHERLASPSATPPYGIKVGDERIGAPRVQAALALCHGRIDVNIGVAVRSAEAAGFSEVFVVGNQPLMRSAMRGTDLVMNVEQVPDGAALLSLARERGYQIVAVQQTPCSVPFHLAHYPPKPLFLMGAEDEGLPDSLRIGADLIVEIPMFGEIDSLNVASAATTVMFHWRLNHITN